MNTEKVYIGRIYEVDSIDDHYYGQVNLVYNDTALMILRRNVFGRKYMKDLNTGVRYNVKLSSRKGSLYVSRTYLESFNDVTKNQEKDLPKEKILKLGNEYLEK